MDRELPSGRFVLRLDPALHATLRRAAAEVGLSLNEYCARKLSGGAADVSGPGRQAVERASAILATRLVGVIVYGYWARGGAASGSDVDVLVVADSDVPIARSLYRRWDKEPVFWEGRRVEPHFVHLPSEDEEPTATWAEVAIDGIVLFDRGLRVARRLVSLRRLIASGVLVRKEAHGQPYWMEAS